MALEAWRFCRRTALWRASLVEHVPGETVDDVLAVAVREYGEMVPEVRSLPKGVLYGALRGTYEFLAYGKALRAQGVDEAVIGAVFQTFHSRAMDRAPGWVLGVARKLALPWLRRRLKAESTHREGAAAGEEESGRWGYAYVEGTPGSKNFGIDVTSCAVCHLFRRHQAEALVPHLCRLDDGISERFDLGLRRDGTLALGAKRCDFRFQPGGEPRPLPKDDGDH